MKRAKLAGFLGFACACALASCASSGSETQGDDSSAGGSAQAGSAGVAGKAGQQASGAAGATAGGTGGASGGAGGGGAAQGGSGGACKLVAPYSSKNAACNGCAEQKCCVEINGCLGEVVCNDTYVNCILACSLLSGDAGKAEVDACIDKCGVDAPDGKAAYEKAIGCADARCAAECN